MKLTSKIRFILTITLLSTTKFVISAKERPNIILIMTDDQGWFDAGFNGNKMIQTPNLDALAQQGVIFDRFYSASSVCSPTRASVMTGRNPNRMGIPSANTGHLKLEEITIAELLRKEGYATGHFGKWHLGTLTKKVKDANRGGKEKHFEHFTIPSMHGYDEFFCTESKVPTYDPMIYPTTFKEEESKKYGWTAIPKDERSEAYNTFYWVDKEQKASNDLSGDDTKLIVDQVIPFIHQSVSNKKPFFTTVWPHTPHLPVVTSEYYKNKYAHLSNKEQLYYGCITALDEQIGRLWQELKELGLVENTMIWFCSDNGPENGTPGSAGKFRARKRSLYEGGVRTPAFVVWKKELAGNQRLDFPAYTSDYMPTILNILNIEYPDNRPVDGMDIMPLIQHSSMQREKPMGFQFNNRISWVTHQYKLISEDAGKTFELYDLINDEKEQINIIQNNSELAQHMKEDLLEWKKSVSHSLNGNDY